MAEITSGVHAVPAATWSRVYLIEEGGALVLVDSGFPWSPGRVLAYIESIGRRPDDVTHILMTHSHPDHASGALRLARRTGAAIAAHHADAHIRQDGSASLGNLGHFGPVRLSVPFLGATPVAVRVEDGKPLPLPIDIEAVHTPGHTPGSVSYLMKKTGVLFSGDTLFSDGRRLSRSLPFPGSNRMDYRASVQRLAALEFDILCGGHGRPLMGGASDALRALTERRPDPPTWGDIIKRAPKRIFSRTLLHE